MYYFVMTVISQLFQFGILQLAGQYFEKQWKIGTMPIPTTHLQINQNFPKPQGSSYFCDSSLYASKGIFDEAAVIYQEDLNKKGYKYKLKHEPSPPITQRKTYCFPSYLFIWLVKFVSVVYYWEKNKPTKPNLKPNRPKPLRSSYFVNWVCIVYAKFQLPRLGVV